MEYGFSIVLGLVLRATSFVGIIQIDFPVKYFAGGQDTRKYDLDSIKQ
jgi:hypothetical protein